MEEADESLFWIELLIDSKIVSAKDSEPYLKEAKEILSIMAKSRKTAKEK